MLNPEEEKKFAELRERCRNLKVLTVPDVFIGLQVHDRNGVLVFDDLQRGHSWTRNFYNFAFCAMADSPTTSSTFGAGYMNAKNNVGSVADNATYTLCKTSNMLGNGFHGSIGYNTKGIVVGTGNAAFSLADYILNTVIAHGNASGELFYQAQANAVPSYDSTPGAEKWTNVHTRLFNNNSGAAITVKETGLMWFGGIFASSASAYYLLERSVLDPVVEVANGAQLTVTYSISMDFSAID